MANHSVRMREAASYVNGNEVVDLLQSLIRIPSPTGEEREVAQFIADYMRDAGFDEVEVDAEWNVLGTIRGAKPGPSLLTLTHTDTGIPGRMEDPFSGELRDGGQYGKDSEVVYGRGAAAPKCALSCYLNAGRALIEWGRENLSGTLQVACVIKDLNANHDGIRGLHQSIGLSPDFVIAGEPSNNQVVMGARGISHVRVTFQGKETHWGKPAEGVNPLYGLGQLLLNVENLSLPTHEVLGAATTSAIEVASEMEPPHTPHEAWAVFDRRVLPEETIDDVLDAYRELATQVVAERPGLTATVEQVRGMYSFAADPDSRLKQALLEAGAAVTGEDIGTTFITFSSNAGFVIRELGVPGVAFAPGRITDVGPQEHVEASKVVEGTEILAAACAWLLS